MIIFHNLFEMYDKMYVFFYACKKDFLKIEGLMIL